VTGTREEEKELQERSFKDIMGGDSDGDDDVRRVKEELQVIDESSSSEDGGGGGVGEKGDESEEEERDEDEDNDGDEVLDVGGEYKGGKNGREERRRIAIEKARLHDFDSDDGSGDEEGTDVDKALNPSWLRGDGKVVRHSSVGDDDDDDDDEEEEEEEEEEEVMISEGGVREREEGSGMAGRESGEYSSSVDSEVEGELFDRPQPGRYNLYTDQRKSIHDIVIVVFLAPDLVAVGAIVRLFMADPCTHSLRSDRVHIYLRLIMLPFMHSFSQE
jgi:hypothetical protein